MLNGQGLRACTRHGFNLSWIISAAISEGCTNGVLVKLTHKYWFGIAGEESVLRHLQCASRAGAYDHVWGSCLLFIRTRLAQRYVLASPGSAHLTRPRGPALLGQRSPRSLVRLKAADLPIRDGAFK